MYLAFHSRALLELAFGTLEFDIGVMLWSDETSHFTRQRDDQPALSVAVPRHIICRYPPPPSALALLEPHPNPC